MAAQHLQQFLLLILTTARLQFEIQGLSARWDEQTLRIWGIWTLHDVALSWSVVLGMPTMTPTPGRAGSAGAAGLSW